MMISPNRRPVCGQSSATPTLSLNARLNPDAKVKIFRNVTKVQDWNTASINPNGIAPYTRKHNNEPSDFSCFPPDFDCCQGYTQPVPCCEIPDPSEILPCGNGTSSVEYGAYHNCYAPTDETASSPCFVRGFKVATAKKAWTGMYSYTSPVWGAHDFIEYCGDNQCRYSNYKPIPDTTKYLSATANASSTVNTVVRAIGGSGLNATATANQSVTIDRFSGNPHVTACASGSDNPTNPDYDSAQLFAQLGDANSNIGMMENNFTAIFLSNTTAFGLPTSRARNGPTAFTLTWTEDDECHTNQIVSIVTVDIAGGTLDWQSFGSDPYVTGCPRPWQLQSHSTWTYTATSFSFVSNGIFWSESIIQTSTENVAGSLGTPYTAHQAYQDAKALLDKFPINNDVQYPWRLDQLVTRGPLICYDEVAQALPLLATSCNPPTQSSGKILGLPTPPGYEPFWNPVQPVWQNCVGQCSDNSEDTFWYLDTYGEHSVGAQCATNWLTALDSQNQFHGAYAAMDFQYTIPNCGGFPFRDSSDTIWVSKYAESQIAKPSVNYARPCGPDRWAVEQASSSCVQTVVGSVVTVLDTSFLSNGLASICGTGNPAVDGFWNITVNNPTTVTLNRLIASASTFPAPFDCGDTGIIAMLRWPGAPPICGRNYITHTTGSPVTASLKSESYLVNGDQIWAFDTKGNVSNQTVTVINASKIVFNGTVDNPNVQWSYITARFAADWRWDDNSSKGDYVITTVGYNYRDIGEYERLQAQSQSVNSSFDCDGNPCDPSPTIPEPRPYQSQWGLDQAINKLSCSQNCLAPSPCNNVICVSPSPSVDVFPNGRTHQLPEPIWDGQYGSVSRVIIKQHDTDPFAEPPPCPCRKNTDDGFNECDFFFVEDDGSCQGDDLFDIPNVLVYPHLPLVEARCSPPVGAPTLPDGLNIGCLDQSQIDVPNQPKGNICIPPALGEAGPLPWVIWSNMENCVCSDPPGRFADNYVSEQDIICLPAP